MGNSTSENPSLLASWYSALSFSEIVDEGRHKRRHSSAAHMVFVDAGLTRLDIIDVAGIFAREAARPKREAVAQRKIDGRRARRSRVLRR